MSDNTKCLSGRIMAECREGEHLQVNSTTQPGTGVNPKIREDVHVPSSKPKRKTSTSERLDSGNKRRRCSLENGESGVLKKFGHLVRHSGLTSVKHSAGKIAIPEVEIGDSEFEDELLVKETPETLFHTYEQLAEDIIKRSGADVKTTEALRDLCFIVPGGNFPVTCPVEKCTRSKPVYGKAAYVRHMVERHLPERPMWRCPFSGGKCQGKQPRLIAHIRHVSWKHGRSYPMAAALTFHRDDLLTYEKNTQYGRKSEKVHVSPRSRFKRIVISSSSSESEAELDQDSKYELVEELSMVVETSSLETPGSIGKVLLPEATGLESFTPLIGPPRVPEAVDPSEVNLADVSPGGPVKDTNQSEAQVAVKHLLGVMGAMDATHKASPPLKKIPELFLFEKAPTKFLDPRTQVIENMVRQLEDLSINCGAQAQLCQGIASSMNSVRRLADEHEGVLQTTGQHIQDVVDLQKQLFKAQQGRTEREWKITTLEGENTRLKQELASKVRSTQLLEDHVRTLQDDVKRLTQDNREAEEKLQGIDLTKDRALEGLAAQVAAIIEGKHTGKQSGC